MIFPSPTAYDKAPLEDILEMTFPVDPDLKPRVKEQLQATVVAIAAPDDRCGAQLHQLFQFRHGAAGRCSPAFVALGVTSRSSSGFWRKKEFRRSSFILRKPSPDFCLERYRTRLRSGMWQFIQWRGRQYGLNQTAYTDDRLDPEKATRSAARHLRDLYEKFGDWYLAIAGYNCGDGCVEKAVQRTGYADFWDLRARNAIPKETTNYVPIILAMTIMHKNAKDYGLEEIEIDPPLTYDTMELEAPTHLALVADIADRPVSEIRELNPSLLTSVAPAGYQLHVPEGTQSRPSLRGWRRIPAGRRASWRIHRVGPGDTLEIDREALQYAGEQHRFHQQSVGSGDRRCTYHPNGIPGGTDPSRLPRSSLRKALAKRSTKSPARRCEIVKSSKRPANTAHGVSIRQQRRTELKTFDTNTVAPRI